MNDNTNLTRRACCSDCTETTPPTCPTIMSIITSIAHQEDALACILNAECAKINKVVTNYSDLDDLLAIDTSVEKILIQTVALEATDGFLTAALG